jgi:16S rRNA (cytidine1402-2'-O)-methyltransferase
LAPAGEPLPAGLYLVGTPIGNLEDITLRALRVLRSVDRILCEDTRETRHLLERYDIRKPLASCHEHNEETRAAEMVDAIRAGERVAMVSDAGMPGISDPGARLARAAIEAGLAVTPVPGANAALTALVGSGLSTERFLFCGFLSSKPGARRTEMERLASVPGVLDQGITLVFYEAPHRLLEMLGDVETVWGAACRVAVGRELTKLHEEFLRGDVASMRAEFAARERVRGELVVLVEAGPGATEAGAEMSLAARVAELMAREGLSEKDALKRVARERGVGKSEAYREWQRERSR